MLSLSGCLHDTGMTFILIPEWVSFQSAVRTLFTKSNGSAQGVLARVAFSPQIRYKCATCPRLHDLRFSIRNEVYFQFTWYQNEISSTKKENFIRSGNRNELIAECLVWERNVVSVSCNKNTEKYITEMPNELVPEWKSFRYHVNRPLTSSPETYIYKAEGVGIIKITFGSTGIHRIWGIFYSLLRSFAVDN